MNVKALLTAALAAALPLAAHADGGDQALKQLLEAADSLRSASTRSVADVRAETRGLMLVGEQHPVELQMPVETMRTRADVQREVATHGVVRIGA